MFSTSESEDKVLWECRPWMEVAKVCEFAVYSKSAESELPGDHIVF